MAVAVICCKMIKNEFQRAYDSFNLSSPIIWLDAGLHNYPEKLKIELQYQLDNLPKDIDKVILGYGLCGKAVIGLKTGNFELVMPKTDDCIAFMLGSNKNKINNKATYFITENWISDEKSMFAEYEYATNKYGKEKCNRIFKRQFKNYTTLGIIDTGCYDVNSIINSSKEISSLLNLNQKVIKTDCKLIYELFDTNVKDNDKFVLIKKNSEITENLFFNFYGG